MYTPYQQQQKSNGFLISPKEAIEMLTIVLHLLTRTVCPVPHYASFSLDLEDEGVGLGGVLNNLSKNLLHSVTPWNEI